MRIEFDPRDVSQVVLIARICDAITAGGGMRYEPESPIAARAEEYPDDTEYLNPADAFDAPNPEQAFAMPPAGNEPAPSPTAAPSGAPIASVELDSSGLPWDARIHSGPTDKKPKNADGTWRRKRGTDDATMASVTAELRQVMGAPAPVAAPVPTPPAAAVAVSPEPAPVPAPPVAPVAPPPTPEPVAMASGPAAATLAVEPAPLAPTPVAATQPAPTPAVSPAALSFADLMRKITAAQTSGALTVQQTIETAQALGLNAVRDLINRPDLIASFDALLPVPA